MGRPYYALLFLLFFISSPSLLPAEVSGPNENDRLEKIFQSYQHPVQFSLDELTLQSRSRWSSCNFYKFRFTVSDPVNLPEPFEVYGSFYMPKPSETKDVDEIPFVLQLPPISGVNLLDNLLATHFCNTQMAAMVIANDFTGLDRDGLPPPEEHMLAYRQVVASAKGALELLSSFPKINREKAGIFGVSLGGILGALIHGVLDDFSAASFIVAGSDAPRIMAISEEKRVKRLRQLRMEDENISSVEDYEDYLRSFMDHDPADFAHRVSPDSVQLVISQKDANVPSENQIDLWARFGKPETTFAKSGHTSVVINTLIWKKNRQKIIDFFSELLK